MLGLAGIFLISVTTMFRPHLESHEEFATPLQKLSTTPRYQSPPVGVIEDSPTTDRSRKCVCIALLRLFCKKNVYQVKLRKYVNA